MRVLITGSQGFVGTETRKLFNELGLEYIDYDLMLGQDVRDYQQLCAFIEQAKPDRILHLAAIARFAEADKDPYLVYLTNYRGTENIASVSTKYHIPLVYASTGSVYMPIMQEPPIKEDWPAIGNSVYGCSKAFGEKVIARTGMPWIALRYAHIYGREKRYHGLIGGFLSRIEFGLEPELYGGKQSNDFTYIADIAEANYQAVTAPWDKWNQAYNIGTGEELTAKKAGDIICEFAGYKGKIIVKPQRTVDPGRFVYDTTKAEIMLGFKAKYTFKKGLNDMFAGEKVTLIK